MVYVYKFAIFGDQFIASNLVNNIKGDFIMESHFNPNNKKFNVCENEKFEYGGAFFCHPKRKATDEYLFLYEQGYIDFLVNNYQLLIDNGATKINLELQLLFDGISSKFEIFNVENLNILSKYNVSIHVNIKANTKQEIFLLEKDIKFYWY